MQWNTKHVCVDTNYCLQQTSFWYWSYSNKNRLASNTIHLQQHLTSYSLLFQIEVWGQFHTGRDLVAFIFASVMLSALYHKTILMLAHSLFSTNIPQYSAGEWWTIFALFMGVNFNLQICWVIRKAIFHFESEQFFSLAVNKAFFENVV